MTFLLSMPNDGQSNNYIINALNDAGHKVFFIDHRAHLKECLEHVPGFLQNEKIDVFLSLFLEPGRTYTRDYIQILKGKFPHVKYLAWIYDTTIGGQYCDENEEFVKIVKEYDYFFTVCRGQVDSFKAQGVNAFFVPEGAHRYTYKFKEDKEYDVSFIGQVGHPEVHTGRLPLLKRIIQRYDKTIIYGPLYAQDPDIMTHHAKRPTFNDVEHSHVVGQSKINIGHSGWPHIEGYFSARNYRIMGSGGFLLANHTNNIESFFEIDKEIVTYKSTEECMEKIAYYLKHDEEREKIAMAGCVKVNNNYTFDNSIAEIRKIIKE